MSKKTLIICRNAPYGSTLSREAIDVALAGAVFDQEVSILFMDDGVYQLVDKQQPDKIDQKNQHKLIASLEMYDIEQLYAEQSSLDHRGLNTSQIHGKTKALSAEEVTTFIASHQIIMSF